MRKLKLHRTILLLSAIALGCISVTPDAFARGGVGGVGGAGGRGVGHAAPSAGAASSHAGAASSHAGPAPRGAPIGGVSHARSLDGASTVHVGQGFGWD
jgi:hypothetical protein